MSTLNIVINLDVLLLHHLNDYESYLHRVYKTGSNENPGIVFTLFDIEEEEKIFFEIITHHKLNKEI